MPTAPPNRPTTPLRTPSRLSQRASSQTPTLNHHSSSTAANNNNVPTPLTSLEPAFAELSDALADLESNMTLLHLQHESISRFTENFAAFLYGLDMNAYCVDWIEAPSAEVWKRRRERERERERQREGQRETRQQNSAMHDAAVVGDVSMMSTTSTRTAMSYSSSSTRGLRTPGRKSGIARAAKTRTPANGYTSRSASVLSSAASTGSAAREGISGRGTRGRGRAVGIGGQGGRSVRGSGRGAANGVVGGSAVGSGIGRGRGQGRGT